MSPIVPMGVTYESFLPVKLTGGADKASIRLEREISLIFGSQVPLRVH